MPKIHARMSVEIEVTEAEFKKIVAEAKHRNGACGDLPLSMYEHLIVRAKPCDWDDGGYIPGPWLEEDIKYERDCNKAEV